MKIIDQNGRLFGKISVIDVAVIIIAVVMLLALLMRSGIEQQRELEAAQPATPPVSTTTPGTTKPGTSASTGKPALQQQEITFEVLVKNVPDYMAEQLELGDEIYDSSQKNLGVLGTIEEIEVTPGTQRAVFSDGTIEMVEVEGNVDIRLTIGALATLEGYDCKVNGTYRIGLNTARTFVTKYTSFVCNIVDIAVAEPEEELSAAEEESEETQEASGVTEG